MYSSIASSRILAGSIKIVTGTLSLFLLAVLMTGCILNPVKQASKTVTLPFSPKIAQGKALEDAITVGRELDFPAVTRVDKASGMVYFGNFGMPMLGITAQVRVKSPDQLELTVIRYGEFVAGPVNVIADDFTTRFEAKINAEAAGTVATTALPAITSTK